MFWKLGLSFFSPDTMLLSRRYFDLKAVQKKITCLLFPENNSKEKTFSIQFTEIKSEYGNQ